MFFGKLRKQLIDSAWMTPDVLDSLVDVFKFNGLKASEKSMENTTSRDGLELLRGSFREHIGSAFMGVCLSLTAFVLIQIYALMGSSAVAYGVATSTSIVLYIYFFAHWQRGVRAHSACMDKMSMLPTVVKVIQVSDQSK